jgi:hypothetical protein
MIAPSEQVRLTFRYQNSISEASFAYVGKADIKNLTMGGYKVDVDPQAETTTGFNQSCGSDSKGHWQLIIHPPLSGKVPAVVKNLPNMGADLELETVSLLSNGEDVLTIGTGVKSMKLYDVVDFKPSLASSLKRWTYTGRFIELSYSKG